MRRSETRGASALGPQMWRVGWRFFLLQLEVTLPFRDSESDGLESVQQTPPSTPFHFPHSRPLRSSQVEKWKSEFASRFRADADSASRTWRTRRSDADANSNTNAATCYEPSAFRTRPGRCVVSIGGGDRADKAFQLGKATERSSCLSRRQSLPRRERRYKTGTCEVDCTADS